MPESTAIPALDLGRAVSELRGEVEERWGRLLTAHAFVGGDEVRDFERAFAAYQEAEACVGVANGTDALLLALRVLGVEAGDEVLVPAFTFVATAATVRLVGGVPVFVDVEPHTLNLDLSAAAARVGERTVGLVGVHLYGNPFDLSAAVELCDRHGLWLLEDAAQAHGARYEGRRVGGHGRLATWSFYPSKNLGCFGDGGAVSGDDPQLLARLRRLADHGRSGHYHHDECGLNSRLDALQAAVLNCRLPSLDRANERRRAIAARYRRRLAGVGDLELLADTPGAEPVFHQFTLLTGERDQLREHLGGRGIGTGIHYPEALHRQPAFADLETPELPVAEAAGGRVLCLPIYPQLEDREVERVCVAVREYFGAPPG